jgi:G3E family GTPase
LPKGAARYDTRCYFLHEDRLGAPLASHDVSTAFVIDAVVRVVNAKHVKQHLDEVKPDGALVR